ncbi:MAG: hypothetical protein WBK43_07475 [Prolixibacteraceae bacterium]|jgi:hypothetical protein|nr:hypothetical protein [Prolixibacteraceae bacterium]MDI9563409.1 hypothetical protein [Bacteroidota bacterium]HNU78217.1 hypothetical protein [Prolixibacteraceae bacterium]HOS91304.1 hypothetical protein [Prolixibacteraceae bacterium]HPV18841.1 hypothetical protein [Prolixibacteraceae bacterium]
MNRLLIFSLLFTISLALPAQELFFPSKEGIRLTYQNFDKKGKPTGKVKYTIKKVKRNGDDMDITYHLEVLDDKEAQQYVDDEVTVQKRGDKMFLDMSKFLNKSAFPQKEGTSTALEVTGNHMELPLVPLPGTSLPDAYVTISMKTGLLNMKMTANVFNRKVEAAEKITVKGRTFNAFKITSEVNSTVLGVKVNTRSAEWYAYGLGVVKSESYNKKGEIESSMELIEILE